MLFPRYFGIPCLAFGKPHTARLGLSWSSSPLGRNYDDTPRLSKISFANVRMLQVRAPCRLKLSGCSARHFGPKCLHTRTCQHVFATNAIPVAVQWVLCLHWCTAMWIRAATCCGWWVRQRARSCQVNLYPLSRILGVFLLKEVL